MGNIPIGLNKCEKCGEYKGTVKAKDLSWEGSYAPEPDKELTVSCLCDGIICSKCKKNKIHRPISNTYDEETNRVEHYPYFIGMAGCSECQAKKSDEKKIYELVENIKSNIDKSRNSTPEEAVKLVNEWEEIAKESIRSLNQSEIENRNLITEITDTLYRKAMEFESVDIHTNGYIAFVLNRLFWELGQKKARIFYVLDNSLRDDRFKLLLEQFPPAGFAVITPHIGDNLEYEPTTSQTESLPYEKVEKQIKDALKDKKNIFYIERDSSVNYLDRVFVLALNANDEYAKVLRNKAVDDPETIDIEDIELLMSKG